MNALIDTSPRVCGLTLCLFIMSRMYNFRIRLYGTMPVVAL